MASNIRFKRSSVAGKVPTSVQLPVGEIAMNTRDGVLWMQEEAGRILNVRAGAALTEGKFIYVSTFGDDSDDGSSPLKAKKTIKSALGIATAGDTVEVAAGTFVEDNPLYVPPLVAIQGEDLRSTTVVPQNTNQDFFLVNNGVFLGNMSFVGSATTHAVVAFDPTRVGVVTQSPYVRNCTNFIPNSIGMRIDGDLRMGNNGVNGSMVVDSYTQYNQNGVGVSITNKAYAQLVSIFTINSGTSIFCGSGGQCDITNSNSSFGEYGLIGDNVSQLQYVGFTTSSSGIASDRLQIQLGNVKGIEITNFEYDPSTGYSTVTTSEAHNLVVGYAATLSGIGFTCPVSYGATHAVSAFTYDSATGLATVTTSTDHGLVAGGNYKLSGLEFTCTGSPGITTTIFPDGTQGYMFKVETLVDSTSFTSNVGAAGFTHTYVSGGIVRAGINTDIFPDPNIEPGKSGFVFDVKGVESSTKFNIYSGISSIPHTFVQAGIRTVTNFLYDNDSGISTVTVSKPHFLKVGDNVKLDSIEFSCSGSTGVTVNVSNVVYDNTVGIATITTSADHGVSLHKTVQLANIEFSCTSGGPPFTNIFPTALYDSNAAYGHDVFRVSSVNSSTEFEVNVGVSTIVHTYVSGGTATAGVTTTIFPDGSSNYGSIFEVTGITSTTFTIDVGIATFGHTYVSGGTARRAAVSKLYANRPYDGQVLFLDKLYKQLDKIDVTSPGQGYVSTPTVTVSDPEGLNGTTATAEATVENGKIKEITVTNNGSQYINNPTITLTGGSPTVSAGTTTGMRPLYYTIQEATQPDPYTGISTVVFDQVLNNPVGVGTTAFFYQVSLVLASSHSFEWIGSGGDLAGSRPRLGGVGIQSAEVVKRDGGLVVYTSTDQSGNFRIGDDVNINQVTGTISGRAFNQSLLNTVTPLIIALED
ncbi:tail fiber protein [Synechococcus virus S-PRM1]|uniref:Endosialidase n=1 Tax=Synechococcus virus S-PRM1 TaxID=2100130 RepID=A0A346FK93_9CAUD|nr:tail fiber protein [Synechococcus virus S-PRM1]AXN58398.1 endosialidase [Synechococcus virus S-PRM1]